MNKERKKHLATAKVTGFAGIVLIALALGIYKWYNIGFMGEIYSEIAGVSVALLVISLGFLFAGRRVG